MSNIEKASRAVMKALDCDIGEYDDSYGGGVGCFEHETDVDGDGICALAKPIAQALADDGLLAPENTRTEWGVRFSEQYIDVAPSEQAAREKASYIGRPVMRRTVTSAVTEWEVAP